MKDALHDSLKNADLVFGYDFNLGWDARALLAPLRDRAIVKDNLNKLIAAAIVAAARSGDNVLIMSNGGFGGMREKLLQRLAGLLTRHL